MNSIDDFHRKVINSLIKQIPSQIQYKILYGNPLGLGVELDQLAIDQPNFIIVNFDILEHNEFDHTVESITPFSQKFLKMVEQHPNTTFVLLCHVENAQSELTHPRIHIVRYGLGVCRENLKYQNLTPQITKNFASKKNFMCLNRHSRQYRINLVSYLLGLGLDQHGTISFYKKNAQAPTWLERVSWNLTDAQIDTIKPILVDGYKKLKTIDLENSLPQIDAIYSRELDNAKNFDLHLRNLYQDHFVEIVAETQFNVPFFGASEKFKNSVYGCSFPIVLGGRGLVKFLQDLGFDMFDDVIDHSYDQIQDPLDRLCAAINLNRSLLCDNDLVKQLWQSNQHRFLKNIEFIRTDLFNLIEQRAYADFEKIKWNIK
jgi:hypothetical protein